MSDLQGYTGNLNLIENADDIVVFLTQMRIFQQQINVQVLSNSYLIRQSFLKYVVNQALSSLHGESLEIMRTVPLNYIFV